MIRRSLIASLACLSLSGCITYPGDGYYSAPGNTYYDDGGDDGYYGSPGYYGDYSYGNVPRVSISISFGFGSGYPYYGYPSHYGYTRCSAWSPYCFGGFYPSYGYGWGGYWPVYGYGNHHHNPPRHNPKPRPPSHQPDRPGHHLEDRDRPGHNTDYPIGVRPDGPRPRKGQRPDRTAQQPVNEYTQPIAVGDTPEAVPTAPRQRQRTMPLPIVDDADRREFRRGMPIPPQTPIRQPTQQGPVPVESVTGGPIRQPSPIRAIRAPSQPVPRNGDEQTETGGGQSVRFRNPNRNVPLEQVQGQPPRSRGAPIVLQPPQAQHDGPIQQPQAKVRVESTPRRQKAEPVRDDDEP